MEREVILDAENYLGKKFPDNTSDAYLLLTVDGNNRDELERQYDVIAKVCLDLGAIDVFISDTPERLRFYLVCSICFPRSNQSQYYRYGRM